MLETLLNNKLKQRLLQIFFAFPERGFSVLELRQLSGSRKPAVDQALREFVRMQAVATAAKRQKRFFRINPHFRLYGEVEDLVGKEEWDLEDPVVEKLKQIPNLKLAVLSGIFTLQPLLPIDLLLVGQSIDRLRLQRILGEIEKFVGVEINYSVLDPEEYEYRRMMNDRLIRDVLDYPHMIVLGNLK